MKISQLDDKLGIQNSRTSYTTMIINTANAPADDPTTYKISLDCLSNSILDKFKIITHDSTTNKLQTNTMGVDGQGEFDASLTKTDVITLTDVVTGISYDDINKKFIQNKYATATTNTSNDVVTTATLLNDMDLNITQITNTAGKTLATIDEASGKVSATFQDISILSSQVSDKSDAINSSGSTLATSKAVKDAIESLDITQITNTAGKTIATIDEADGKVSATFQDIEVAQSQVTGLTTALGNKLETSLKGANSGLAELDANGHVPSSQLPSYVDDVIEGTIATFSTTGETGKIYVDTTTNISYRWSGSQYVKVASDLALGETSSTAYAGDKGKAAYDHATAKGSAFASGFYKITTNAEGHVTAATTVQASDITAFLGSAATKNVSDSGDASTTEVVLGNDSRLSDARNAADVPSWAKAENPPSTFTTITIGNTTLDETQLTALLALIEGEGE